MLMKVIRKIAIMISRALSEDLREILRVPLSAQKLSSPTQLFV